MTEFRILDKAQITLTVICGKIKNQVDFFGDMVYISSKEQRVLEEYVKIAHEEAQKNEIRALTENLLNEDLDQETKEMRNHLLNLKDIDYNFVLKVAYI